LAFAGEWHWKDFIYLLGGLNFTIPLSDKIQYNKRIIFPEKFTYQNGTVDYTDATFPESIGSLNSLRVGVFGGVGFSYKIMLGFSAFAEATYTYHIGSIISDGDWFVQQISFAAGIKYKIFF